MEIYGADNYGIDGQLVRFRTVVEQERKGTLILGLAGKVVKEGVERAHKAIESLEAHWDTESNHGYTFDLTPAETKKQSPGLDLPIAIMLLISNIMMKCDNLRKEIESLRVKALGPIDDKAKETLIEQLKELNDRKTKLFKYRDRIKHNKQRYLLIGKLDIGTGRIEPPMFGMMGMISAAREGDVLIVPEDSEVHASLVAKARKNFEAYKAKDLEEVWNIILGVAKPRRVHWNREIVKQKKITDYIPDVKAIEGVSKGKIAMMVALAGGHNILLVGPPGMGKSMLSMAALNLLSTPTQEELFEINKIYSAAGALSHDEVVLERPFQQASNNITKPALYGGGNPIKPGLVSLAHNGILLLDEINLFASPLIEELRVPLSAKKISVQRANYSIHFPCKFILVAAMNPCKCGWFDHFLCPKCNSPFISRKAKCPRHPEETLISRCTCSKRDISRYKATLSEPLLDRIDLKILVYDTGSYGEFDYATKTIKTRIKNAREIQSRRYEQNKFISCNADVQDRSQFRELHPNTEEYIRSLYLRLNVTKRMEFKILLVAQTIADLNESTRVSQKHIDQAIDLMGLESPYFQEFMR